MSPFYTRIAGRRRLRRHPSAWVVFALEAHVRRCLCLRNVPLFAPIQSATTDRDTWSGAQNDD